MKRLLIVIALTFIASSLLLQSDLVNAEPYNFEPGDKTKPNDFTPGDADEPYDYTPGDADKPYNYEPGFGK